MGQDQVERFYDSLSKEYAQTHYSRFVDKVFEHFLFFYLPKKKNLKILDGGGGTGRFSFPLAKKGHNVLLLDISYGMLNKAMDISKKLNLKGIKFVKGSVTEMNRIEPDSMDVVLMMNSVLDYCSDPKKALKMANYVLKRNGTIIGTVNNRIIYMPSDILLEKSPSKLHRRLFETGDYHHKFIIHNFTVDELTDSLKKARFKVVDIIGPTNLLRKWEYEDAVNKNNEDTFYSIQLHYARMKEYLNNSSDFMFIAKKR